MSVAPRLELSSVSVRFGSAVGLRGISFSVAAGETLAVVGTSGAGKSSLLRVIAGLDPLAVGSLRIDGVERGSAPPETRGAVYLHQTPLLFPHLSVAENIAFPLRVRRASRSAVEQRVREVLDTLSLSTLRDRDPSTLSGGQRHRVALARAIASRPPVLLLDEPLTGLDPATRAETLDAIRAALADYQPATLYVTHDLEEAGAIASAIGVLLRGSIQQIAAPPDLFEQPATAEVATFVGFANHIRGETDGWTFGGGGLRVPLQTDFAGPAVLLFKPHSLFLDPAGELAGEIVAIAHSPSGPRLRIHLNGLELDATAAAGAAVGRGPARFGLNPSGMRVLRDL